MFHPLGRATAEQHHEHPRHSRPQKRHKSSTISNCVPEAIVKDEGVDPVVEMVVVPPVMLMFPSADIPVPAWPGWSMVMVTPLMETPASLFIAVLKAGS